MPTQNDTMVSGQLTKRVIGPEDDGLDLIRNYLQGAPLDSATEQLVKRFLAAKVPPRDVIETTLEFTYYPLQPDLTEPVDVITITRKNTVTQTIDSVRQIKHYLDGTQPREI